MELINLHKKFDHLHVLKGVNFHIKKNEVVVIIGPSGSGKSTLLRSMNFLEKPDKGQVILDDIHIDCENLKKKEVDALRKKTAMVFQNYNLFGNKTVKENITEALIHTRDKTKKESDNIAIDLLKEFDLHDKSNVYPSKLSGGQKQRVAIARAMALNPSVYLFDEPTSALDPELVQEVLVSIKKVAKKRTASLCIVTHQMAFAKEIADRIIFMDDGIIVEENDAEIFFSQPRTERAQKFLSKFDS